MAKAQLTLPSGTKVLIEGSEEEVALLLVRIDGGGQRLAPPKPERSRPSRASNAKQSIGDLIEQLLHDGLFNKPIELAAVKAALEQQGRYFSRSAIPTQLLRLVKRRQLRRIKQGEKWHYVR